MKRKKNHNKSHHKKAKILIVDDHAVVRKGIAYLIEREMDLTVCGECEDGVDVLPAIIKLNPDVVVLDLFLKDMNGIDLLKDITKRYPKLSVLVLSMHHESLYAERVLRAGAMGYVSKEDVSEKVVLALRQILKDEIYADESLKAKLLKKILRDPSNAGDSIIDQLSNRELEVFQMLGQGYSTRRIAERWRRSIKTVETYRAHIKQKLHLTSAADLVHYAVQWMQKEVKKSPPSSVAL